MAANPPPADAATAHEAVVDKNTGLLRVHRFGTFVAGWQRGSICTVLIGPLGPGPAWLAYRVCVWYECETGFHNT